MFTAGQRVRITHSIFGEGTQPEAKERIGQEATLVENIGEPPAHVRMLVTMSGSELSDDETGWTLEFDDGQTNVWFNSELEAVESESEATDETESETIA